MRAVKSVLFLALLSLLSLIWVRLGVPWVALVASFVLVPAVDLLAGRGAGTKEPSLSRSRRARWVPRFYPVFQIVLLADAVRLAPSLTLPT